MTTILIIEKNDNLIKASLFNQNGKLYCEQSKFLERKQHKIYGFYYDPHEFIYLCSSVINDLLLNLSKKHKVNCVGIVGDMDTFLFCDLKTGSVLTPAFWLRDDKTSSVFSKINKTSLNSLSKTLSQMELSQFSLFMNLKWFLAEGQSCFTLDCNKASCMSLETYLLYSLSGNQVFQSDFISMSYSGFFDFDQKKYSDILLDELGLKKRCFPELRHPFQFKNRTQGFVPLNNGIPISIFTSRSPLNWLCHQDVQYGSLHLHIDRHEIFYEKFLGSECVDLDHFLSKSYIINQQNSSVCYQGVVKIPSGIMPFSSLDFHDFLGSKISFIDNKKLWFILRLDGFFSNDEFALINHGVSLDRNNFSAMVLEGVFCGLKMKLEKLNDSFRISNSSIYCTSNLFVDDSIFQLLSNMLQCSISVVNEDEILKWMVQYYFLKYLNLKSGSRNITKLGIKTYAPDQDPISNYVNYNSWLNYYNKLFVN